MKRTLLSIAIVATALGTAVKGDAYCNNGPCDVFCGSFEVGADVLCLRPSVCDLDYAIVDNRSAVATSPITQPASLLPFGDEKCINPGYDWGFRLFINYLCGCYDLQAQYSGLHTSDRSTTRAPSTGGIWPTYSHPAVVEDFRVLGNVSNSPGSISNTFARAKVKYDYDAVDVNVGRRFVSGCCCDLLARTWIGLHYFHLNERFEAYYQGNQLPNSNSTAAVVLRSDVRSGKHRLWAIGPQLGLDSRYDIWCGFGVGARVSAAVVAGEAKGDFRQTSTQQTGGGALVALPEVRADACTRHYVVIPVFDTRLGINYTWDCNDCVSFFFEIGYEFISYVNALGRLTFNDQRGTSSTDCTSFNLDGFYLTVMVAL